MSAADAGPGDLSVAVLKVLAPLRLEARAARRGVTTADVVVSGMGAQRSRRTASEVSTTSAPDQPVAVVGVAGGVDRSLKPGDIVVADALRTVDRSVAIDVPGAALVAGELTRAGLCVHVGTIVTSPNVVKGPERAAVARAIDGALAVDMESAWLAAGLGVGRRLARPFAVVRVVLDTPDHELVSLDTLRNVRLARERLAAVMPPLERWAAEVGPRNVTLAEFVFHDEDVPFPLPREVR